MCPCGFVFFFYVWHSHPYLQPFITPAVSTKTCPHGTVQITTLYPVSPCVSVRVCCFFLCLALTHIWLSQATSFNQDVSHGTCPVSLSRLQSPCVSVQFVLSLYVWHSPIFAAFYVASSFNQTCPHGTCPKSLLQASKSVCVRAVCYFACMFGTHTHICSLLGHQFQPRRVLMGHVQNHFSDYSKSVCVRAGLLFLFYVWHSHPYLQPLEGHQSIKSHGTRPKSLSRYSKSVCVRAGLLFLFYVWHSPIF